MNMKKIVTLLFCLNANFAGYSMEDRVSKHTHGDSKWHILPDYLINQALDKIPAQTQSFTCGHLTIAHALTVIGEECDYQEIIENCPLSVEADIATLKKNEVIWGQLSGHMSDEAHKEGCFRIGGAPEQLEGYVNERLLGSKFIYITVPKISSHELQKIILESFEHNLPVIVLIRPKAILLHYLLVVGINVQDQEILIMDTKEANQKLRVEKISAVLAKMDASEVVNLIKLIDNCAPILSLMGINLNALMTQRVSSEILQRWNSMSVLQMLPCEEAEQRIRARKDQEQREKVSNSCAQQ